MDTLSQLKNAGLRVTLTGGGNLKCGPRHLLTPEFLTLIREHKADIIRELRREGPPYPDGQGRVKCFYCVWLRKGRCQITRELMFGISLLLMCKDFTQRETP
jgi:hypothetical protein